MGTLWDHGQELLAEYGITIQEEKTARCMDMAGW